MNLVVPRAISASLVVACAMNVLLAFVVLPLPLEWSFDASRLVPPLDGAAGTVWTLGFLVLGGSTLVPRLLVRPTTEALAPDRIVARAFTVLVLMLALSEFGAMCGLVSSRFLGEAAPERVLLPALGTAVGILTRFPTEARMRAWAGLATTR